MVDIERAAASLIASQPDGGPSVDELAVRWQRSARRRRLAAAAVAVVLVAGSVAVSLSYHADRPPTRVRVSASGVSGSAPGVSVSAPGASVSTTSQPAGDKAGLARCDISPAGGNVVEQTVTIDHVVYYRFVNVAATPCRLSDAPTLQLLDSKGHRLRTVSDVANGGAGTGRRHPITLRPHTPVYLNLQVLTRSDFQHPPKRVCPTSSALRMTFPGSRGAVLIKGRAGRLAPYEQYGHHGVANGIACGLINILPLSRTPTDSVGA
jgi:hypothetical protein